MSEPLAIVSGGTRGIGLALSSRLLRMGNRVVALYRQDDLSAEQAARELGAAFTALKCDVSIAADVAAAVNRIVADHGAPRVLINNAGRNIDRPFLDMTPEEWQQVLDVNLTGAFLLTKATVPHMFSITDPVIINIGSTTAMRPRKLGANYCASKAGLVHLTKCLALELAPAIRVNCLIPGMTETDELIDRFDLQNPVALARVLDEIPRHRLGQADDIADALEFLIGTKSSYINGQKLIVDGGQFMW